MILIIILIAMIILLIFGLKAVVLFGLGWLLADRAMKYNKEHKDKDHK